MPHFVYPVSCQWIEEFIPAFWLLWIRLLWTWVLYYLFETLILIILGIFRSWIVSPPQKKIHMLKFLLQVSQNMTVFEDKVFKKVIALKWGL